MTVQRTRLVVTAFGWRCRSDPPLRRRHFEEKSGPIEIIILLGPDQLSSLEDTFAQAAIAKSAGDIATVDYLAAEMAH